MNRPFVRACAGTVLTLCLGGLAASANAQPADWDTIKATGGTAAFRCVADLPARIPRARLLFEAGRRIADTGPNDPWSATLARYAAWLRALDDRMTAFHGSGLSLSDQANQKAVDAILDDLGIAVRRRGERATAEARAKVDQLTDRFVTCVAVSREELVRRLSAGDAVAILPPPDDVPLPVKTAVWSALHKDASPERPFLSIIADRDALMQYAALASLDAETVAFVTQASVWSQLSGSARLLAAYGSAIRVSHGRVDVPGGDELASDWERFISRSPAKPAEFIRAVLQADEGHLAYFYATLDSFDSIRVKAVLGDRDAARRLYDLLLLAGRSTWIPFQHALSVPDFNLLTVAADIRLGADGLPIGPRSRNFWRRAFALDDLPDRSDRPFQTTSDAVTLSWLLEQVFANPVVASRRHVMISFVQRVLPSPNPAPAALTAAVAAKRLPALVLTLERMGIRDPEVYGRVARRADSLVNGDTEIVTMRLRQWQAAIGLVDAMRRTGAIDVPQATASLQTIASWEPGRDGGFARPIAEWLQSTVWPLLPADAGDAPGASTSDHERRLYRLISGSKGRHGETIKWEGLSYELDLALAHARRAEAIARIEARPSLDDVLALTHDATVLQQAARAGDVAPVTADLEHRLPRFTSPIPAAPWFKRRDPLVPQDILKTVLKELGSVRRDRDVRRAQREASTLWWLSGQLLADVLPAVLYAGRLGAAGGAAELYADLWRRHELAGSETDLPLRAWQIPEERPSIGTGVVISGSLLGFDIALGRVLLRRIGGGPAPARIEIPPPLVRTITETVALEAASSATPQTATAELDQAVGALRRGRARWAAFVADPRRASGWPDPLRANVVAWMKGHEPAQIDGEVSVAELAALGTVAADTQSLADLGVPGDCWCLTLPSTTRFVTLGPRTLPSTAADLPLRVAEVLAELRMPLAVLPPIAAAGFADVLDSVAPAHAADWLATSDAVRQLSRDRIEQLVFSLVTTRELTIAKPADRLP